MEFFLNSVNFIIWKKFLISLKMASPWGQGSQQEALRISRVVCCTQFGCPWARLGGGWVHPIIDLQAAAPQSVHKARGRAGRGAG